MDRQIIEAYLKDYLVAKGYNLKKSGQVTQLECPYCKKTPSSAIIPPRCNFASCFACGAKRKTIFDFVRDFEKIEAEDDIIQHVKDLLGLSIETKKDLAYNDEVLKYYESQGFDMVPVARNKKNPIEMDWVNKSHKYPDEWKRWLADGCNIGVKTGERSGILVIDIDCRPTPPELLPLLGETLIQETPKGTHYFYKYTPELSKTRINDLKTDIETNGGQVLLYPSIVDGASRKIQSMCAIAEMPKPLLDFLKARITVPLKSFSEKIKEDIQTEEFNLKLIDEGSRNASLIKLGGLFRKELNVQQTEHVLNVLNTHACESPLHPKEISAMVKSLSRYVQFDEQELAHKVLTYLKDVEECQRTEIAMAIMGTNRGEDKMRIDKVLKFLCKEQYILKKGRNYCIIKKLEWKETLLDVGKPVDFKVPYFDDCAKFCYEDMILVCARNKVGKTSISVNMIKQLVDQGITPYLINLERGGRFAKIALQLGLKDGDFKHSFCSDPTAIELEKNAVTIIDWLLITDKSETDVVFKHFIEQLNKQGGFLIIFQQLKDDNSYFAPNMAKQFPALAVRYMYDDERDGTYGKFVIDVIREPKGQMKSWEIPCKYDYQTKIFERIDQLEKLPEPNKPVAGEEIEIDEKTI